MNLRASMSSFLAALAFLLVPIGIFGQSTVKFSFSGYGNPQRPFPGYAGIWQLGPVSISGSGEVRASDGVLISGGRITHSDSLRDQRYPNHNTTWQVVRSLGVTSSGGRTTLRLQVQVVGSNYPDICPSGTYGIVELVDQNSKMRNGQASDSITTMMPNPGATNSRGSSACGTHTHGMNNMDYSWTDPRYGGPGGGIFADVRISGSASGCSNLSGSWGNLIASMGGSTWKLSQIGTNRYRATETGLGNASGTAVLSGRRLRLDFQVSDALGFYMWDLKSDCSSGNGYVTWTRGGLSGKKQDSTIVRK